MRRRLLRWLCCPSCRGDLSLDVLSQEPQSLVPPAFGEPLRLRHGSSAGPTDFTGEAWSMEVHEGVLRCACGAAYAIRDGIPRMHVRGATAAAHGSARPQTLDRGRGAKLSERTRECYDYLWRFKAERMGWNYRPDGEKDWFLENMDLREADVLGATLLDAGCGDGRLTSFLGRLGIEAVGIDLSEGVDVGYQGNDSLLVHYVQGDLLNPPFKKDSFDLLWSMGVLHHTANTKRAFNSCVDMLRPGGKLFVWLYDKAPERRGLLIKGVQGASVKVKRCVSRATAMANGLKKRLRGGAPVTRTQSEDEVYFWNLDMYGPGFRHLHQPSEVEGWFEEFGFMNVSPKARMEYGFGLNGDLPRSDGAATTHAVAMGSRRVQVQAGRDHAPAPRATGR